MVSVTLAMFQLLMSWLKEVAPLNIAAHAHTRRKHGEAGAEGGCEEGCRGAGRDAPLVSVTLDMFQLLSVLLKDVAPRNIPAHAHTRRKHGEAGRGRGRVRRGEARGGTHCRCSSRRSCPSC